MRICWSLRRLNERKFPSIGAFPADMFCFVLSRRRRARITTTLRERVSVGCLLRFLFRNRRLSELEDAPRLPTIVLLGQSRPQSSRALQRCVCELFELASRQASGMRSRGKARNPLAPIHCSSRPLSQAQSQLPTSRSPSRKADEGAHALKPLGPLITSFEASAIGRLPGPC